MLGTRFLVDAQPVRSSGRSRAAVPVAAGKAVTAAANALLLLAAAHLLPAREFGPFAAVAGGSAVGSRLLLLGAEAGVTRLRSARGQEQAGARLTGAGLVVLLVMAAWAVLACWGAAAGQMMPAGLAGALLLGTVGGMCVEYSYWLALAEERYLEAVSVQAGTALARLLVAGSAAWWWGAAGVSLAFGLTSIMLGGLALAAALPGMALPRLSDVRTVLRDSAWPGCTTGLTALVAYAGTLALLARGQPAEAGVLSLAITLSSVFFVLSSGFSEYLLVSAVQWADPAGLRPFLRQSYGQTLRLGAACVALAGVIGLAAPYLVPAPLWAGGTAYAIYTAGLLVGLLHAPLHAACHFLLRPEAIFWNTVLRLLTIGTCAWTWSAAGGAVEAAWAHVIGHAASLVHLLLVAVAAQYREPAEPEYEEA